jgi:hypothetical protein
MQDFLVLDLNISRILGSMGMNGTWAGEDELPEDMIISVRLFVKQVLGCLLLRYLRRADVEDFGHGLCWIAGNERIGLGREAGLIEFNPMAAGRLRADVGEGFGMRDRAATHQIRYRPTTSKSGWGFREFRAHSSQKKAYYSQILYTCRVYRSVHFSYSAASIE